MSQKFIATAWSGFTAVLLILFIAGWYMFDSRFQHIIDLSSEEADRELTYIAELVHEKLQKRDYQQAKDFIRNWGERTQNIAEINLISDNGYLLAQYRSSKPFSHIYSNTRAISYSYDKQASLTVSKSLDEVYSSYRQFIYQLLAGFVFIIISLFTLTYTLVRIQKQKLAIRQENTQRKKAEKSLIQANKEIREREQNLAITLNSIGDAVITTDNTGLVTQMNPVAERLTGWILEEAKNKAIEEIFVIIDASTRIPIENPIEKVISSGKTVYLSNHTVLLAKDNVEYHIADSAAPIRKDNEAIRGAVLVFNDVSESKQAEEEIRTLYQAIEQSPISITITNAKAEIEYVNACFQTTTGYSTDEVIGKNPRFLQSGKTPAKVYKKMWHKIRHGKPWQGELLNRKKNGELFWENVHIAPVLDQSGEIQHYLAVREDISLRKQQEEKILHQAHFDTLTGLPNRFLSLDRLSQLISEADRKNEKVALLFLDLDDFKKVNDTLGHDIGDKLLIEAAHRLKQELRSGDTVGRLGGDEFIVLLGGLNSEDEARPMAENLLNRFRDAIKIEERNLMITTSIGVAIYPDDGESSSELLRNADSAMYHAKEDGRNTYAYYTDVMNKDVSRRLALEEQMHGALGRGEFYVHYQPKINIAHNKIIGVEALLRWFNPALGHVSPQEFIPVAEQTGLIISIGQFVLKSALDEVKIWLDDDSQHFSMAVNLSPRQFRDPDLVSFIAEALSSFNVPATALELEITEGALMGGHDYIDQALRGISQLGVSIAMDDFGTGYSSLSYLRRYPFNVLKIDRSFVNDITHDKADRELVNASISMAHSLGLKVVAEGVETKEQLELLSKQGCDIAQGYLFSKPVAAAAITEMLKD